MENTKAAKAESAAKAVAPKEAATQSLALEGVDITHPEKMVYEEPKITRGEVAEYYLAVSRRMLPYVAGRVLSTVRCPHGIGSACFYQKHPRGKATGLLRITVPDDEGRAEEYDAITDVKGLLYEVQMYTLEFHVWGSQVKSLEKPDMMVFDLDPDEGLAPEQVRQGVRDLKALLDQHSLVSFLKTSGGKGYHVVVPFCPEAGWPSFAAFAKSMSQTMTAQWPRRYTSDVRKNRRQGRICVDWMRNSRGATSVAPYSLRARAGAPVSMPITWEELDTIDPQGIKMQDALNRLRSPDPWKSFFDAKQQLS